MNKAFILLLLLLIQVTLSNHQQGGSNPAFSNWANAPPGVRPGTPAPQNPAFANWANRPGTSNPQNPAFSNWVNRPGASAPQNPAFANWANRPGGAGPQNPAFNNWLNRPGSAPVGEISGGRAGFSNWLNRPGLNSRFPGSPVRPGLTNSLIAGSLSTSLNLDSKIRRFLTQNRIYASIPNQNACSRYSVPRGASRLRVICVLPNGRRLTQVCRGALCSLTNCKMSFCSRIRGARLLRIPF